MTKEELFKIMDQELSAEDQMQLKEAKDTALLHFGLGTLIRNRFIYGEEAPEKGVWYQK